VDYLHDLPRLTHHYGLKPWELEHLKPAELNAYVAYMPQLDKARGD
jgi:hypothetical protein